MSVSNPERSRAKSRDKISQFGLDLFPHQNIWCGGNVLVWEFIDFNGRRVYNYYMVPEQARKERDFDWLNRNMRKLQGKYVGKFIAVVNGRFSVGNTAISAYNKSREEFPDNEPVMDVVPSKECLLL